MALTCVFSGAEGTRTPDPLNPSTGLGNQEDSRPLSVKQPLAWGDAANRGDVVVTLIEASRLDSSKSEPESVQ